MTVARNTVLTYVRDKSTLMKRTRKQYNSREFIKYKSLDEVVYSDGKENFLSDKLPSMDDYTQLFVDDLLSKLSEKNREVFVLYYEHGFSQMEISKMFGIGQVQISRIIARTKNKLKAILVA